MLPLKDDEEGAKSEPEKTITERVKLTLQKSKKNKQTKKKQKKNRNRNQNLNFKQPINYSSNTVSTNKS